MQLQFNSDEEYIQAVLNHESFPSKPFYWATGKQPKDASFYVKDGQVRSDFVSSEGKLMSWFFYFKSPLDFNPYLIAGTKFV